MFYENAFEPNTTVGKPAIKNTTNISDTCTCGMGASIHDRVYIKSEIQGLDAAIQQ